MPAHSKCCLTASPFTPACMLTKKSPSRHHLPRTRTAACTVASHPARLLPVEPNRPSSTRDSRSSSVALLHVCFSNASCASLQPPRPAARYGMFEPPSYGRFRSSHPAPPCLLPRRRFAAGDLSRQDARRAWHCCSPRFSETRCREKKHLHLLCILITLQERRRCALHVHVVCVWLLQEALKDTLTIIDQRS